MFASKFSVYENGKKWETSLESNFPFYHNNINGKQNYFFLLY